MTGSQFERMVVSMLGNNGYWAHRIVPDARGAQPFDVIASKGCKLIVSDCKVCQSGRFPFSRLEENQRSSFELFLRSNPECEHVGIFAWFDDKFFWLPYETIISEEKSGKSSIKLTEEFLCKHLLGLKS